MNAAFLLVTTAWLAGADPAPADPKADPKDHKDHKPVVVAPAPSSCCSGGYGSCCDDREGLLSRLRNKLRRDDCCDPCGCERERLLDRLRNRFRKDDCCDSGCERESLLDRLRNRFRKNDCCDPCCGTIVTPKAEQLGAPKDGEHHKPLPKGGGGGGKDEKGGENKEVRVIPQPLMAPALEITPITAPKAPPVGVEKSPF